VSGLWSGDSVADVLRVIHWGGLVGVFRIDMQCRCNMGCILNPVKFNCMN
jgi:hypothetical protein